MKILYVKEDINAKLFNYKKGTYLLMANYREIWFHRKWKVETIGHFQMFWGARPCVINLTKVELLIWLENAQTSINQIKENIA